MPQMVIESDAFTHRLGQPTLTEIKNDMLEKFKRQNNGSKMIDIKKSLMDSLLQMDFQTREKTFLTTYHESLHQWEMEYNTKVYSPKKIRNNSRDIFTSLHNYVIEQKVHYPIYKLNAIYDIFYNPNFATIIYNKSEPLQNISSLYIYDL